jgi:uncharacterized lipoprotein YmbA
MKNSSSLSLRPVVGSLLLVPCSLLLFACNLPQPQADTVRNFTLSAPVAATPVHGAAQVRPVQLAGHLRGRQMAVRVAANEVVYLEDVRWAEPLDEAITQLLRARLGSVGGEATVTVQIQRCELVRSEGNRVQLAATWTIQSPAGDGAAAVQRGSFTAGPRTWDGKDYGALVGQIRDAVTELGDTLAAAVGKN